jgi:nucleoside permease NupC
MNRFIGTLGLQFAFAFLILKDGFGKLFDFASQGVNQMLHYSEAGSRFVSATPWDRTSSSVSSYGV